MEYQESKTISLKSHPEYNERWLQDRIAQNPSILGLGDLIVRDVERIQARAGRLDLLLFDPESNTRYEVEIQLGRTDESHIIRTIEYWDIERRRFPMYDHVAVIVAEDITSRFLNVVGLFNGFIPLVAIQLRAIEVGRILTLSATTVLDRSTMIDFEEEELEASGPVNRAFWETTRGSATTVALADEFLILIQQVTGDKRLQLKYNKHYIGLARDGMADNFVNFTPRKHHLQVGFKTAGGEELRTKVEDSGIEVLAYNNLFGRFRIKLSPGDISKHRELLRELIELSSGVQQVDAELEE